MVRGMDFMRSERLSIEEKKPVEKFDQLYKTLLTPISFITAISCSFDMFTANLFFAYPSQFEDIFKTLQGITPRGYLDAILTFIAWDFFFLLCSITIFCVAFYWKKKGEISGRTASLFFLLLDLLFVLYPRMLWIGEMSATTYFFLALLITSILTAYIGIKMEGRTRNIIPLVVILSIITWLLTFGFKFS